MKRLSPLLLALGACVALTELWLPALACGVTGFTVGDNLNALSTPTLNADESYKRFAVPQVQAHFADQLTHPSLQLANSTRSTFSCIDARGDAALLGTPGGDFGELVAAIMAWFKLGQKAVNKADIKKLFDAFMERVARPSRPLYFHTDDSRLRQLFVALKNKGLQPAPSKLPDVAPSNSTAAAMWLDELVKPSFQGCGHIRLQLKTEFTPQYSVKLSGNNTMNCEGVPAADCIDAAEVVTEVLTLFYKYWWFTPLGSPERRKVQYVVAVGPLIGTAISIVSSTNNSGSCHFMHPLLLPNKGGSTLFVYHTQAVQQMRAMAVRVGGFTAASKHAKLAELWNKVAELQLGATLQHLSSASDIGLFPVTVNMTSSKAGGPGRRMRT
ncbi:hypothetical protein OEZ86_003914 [Tetradesmus obliquus]|nr:hypothetical protein OEZ86_003914 [Tetradesmus obliquus]